MKRQKNEIEKRKVEVMERYCSILENHNGNSVFLLNAPVNEM